MRRNDRQITDRNEIEAILAKCQVCHLALCVGNKPYALALNYGFVPGEPPVLYFHGAHKGKKMDWLAQNPFVAFIVDQPIGIIRGETACGWGMKYESVMGEGMIEMVMDPAEHRAGLQAILAQHGGTEVPLHPEAIKGTCVLKLSIQTLTGKRRL